MNTLRMTRSVWTLALVLLAGTIFVAPVLGGTEQAGEPAAEQPSPLDQIKWVVGPSQAGLGDMAEIAVPEGYIFADGKDTQVLMEAMGNIPTGTEVGFLAPEDSDWFVVFEFSEEGYVSDEDKDKLDAAAMLKAIREGTEQGNKLRRERGYPTMTIEGWQSEPHYDEVTHNLEWGIRARNEDGSPVVNYNTRLLGRKGIMEATLVADPEALPAILPVFKRDLAALSYKAGHRYADYRQGDQVAKYGLAALVTGGAAAVAVKSGLLKYLWKILLIGGAAIAALFSKLRGKKAAPQPPQPPVA